MTNTSASPPGQSAYGAFAEHLDAFNDHHTDRLMAGFTDDAQWVTGADIFRGKSALAGLFGPELWTLTPSLATLNLVVQVDRVAAELLEQLVIGSQTHRFHIAVFFNINMSGGLIRAAKVYREGSADLPYA